MISGRLGAKAVTALVALAATTGLACGAENPPPEPSHPLKAALHRLQEGFAAKDDDAVCAAMTRGAQRQAGKIAHAKPTTCPRDVARVFELIEEGGGWLESGRPSVAAMRSRGRAAIVTVEAGGWKADIPFEKEDGEWKLAGFFGMAPRQFARLQRRVSRLTFPDRGGRVKVVDAHGSPCGELSAARYPRIAGGCALKVSGESVTIEMMTPFGAFEFAECDISYRVHVDSTGRTWTDLWKVKYRARTGCGDLWPCIRRGVGVEYLPWKGRVRSDADGGFEHHVDICLRTCVGPFAGELVTRLAPGGAGAGWRVERADVGTTGFRLSDPLDVDGDRLAITATPRRG